MGRFAYLSASSIVAVVRVEVAHGENLGILGAVRKQKHVCTSVRHGRWLGRSKNTDVAGCEMASLPMLHVRQRGGAVPSARPWGMHGRAVALEIACINVEVKVEAHADCKVNLPVMRDYQVFKSHAERQRCAISKLATAASSARTCA